MPALAPGQAPGRTAGRKLGRLPAPARERGQVVVIFALAVAGLIAAAGVAVDIGRFYSERRFLQNAADAAALAAANALVRGASDADAVIAAQNSLARNFLGDPNGVVASLPPTVPVYENGYAGTPSRLLNGIIVSGGEVRVAVENTIGYTFGRVVGLGNQAIGARARVRLLGDLLPIAVRRYINTPGPNTGAAYPCTDNPAWFTDFFATAETSCLGSEADPALRTAPTPGSDFDAVTPGSDPAHHGPILAILGQGAQPNNGADFRGFVALDIRNFASAGSQLYYNGVSPSTNANTLRDLEAGWIMQGYPGPMFPSVVTPPDPNDQVAIMSGNATGIAIAAMAGRFVPGDEILVLVYPGNVMAIPDFAITPPGQVVLPTSGTTASAGSLKVSRNQAFSGTVTMGTLADLLDPLNPLTTGTMTGGAAAITYTPNPVSPALGSGQAVDLTNITTAGAPDGIYTLWVQGQAGSPYLTTKVEPFAVKVGSVTRDFTFTSATTSVDVAAGGTATFDLELTNSPNKNTAFGNPVSLSVDGPLPPGVGSISFDVTSVSPTRTGAHALLSISTGTMAPGMHTFTVRATGMNGDAVSRPVTHLVQITVDVGGVGSAGNQEYVDIAGFAVMRIAAADANVVSAYAITPVITDMNDSQLRRGQVARLVPWN
ncbi:MAG TPA: pilus assembly protein TadG-related protein [Candidatus Sulfomarinibacteraceae bacterium]|nr:pilus assembly protein TadG-related protein [Candidatus Sulfomarinibacteraceae bacterium]